MTETSRLHPDGLPRCAWLNDDPLYIDYHDNEWGVALHDHEALFEKIALEGFQAGLSWFTILRRREGFRKAFEGFKPASVARFEEIDVERLLADPGIIRNRAKILATISNAQIVVERNLDLNELLWNFAPPEPLTQTQGFQWLATSKESDAMSKELKRLGFRFVGSTTMYALMQSVGMVQDHAPDCFRRP